MPIGGFKEKLVDDDVNNYSERYCRLEPVTLEGPI
jgi:hypothetical protein